MRQRQVHSVAARSRGMKCYIHTLLFSNCNEAPSLTVVPLLWDAAPKIFAHNSGTKKKHRSVELQREEEEEKQLEDGRGWARGLETRTKPPKRITFNPVELFGEAAVLTPHRPRVTIEWEQVAGSASRQRRFPH